MMKRKSYQSINNHLRGYLGRPEHTYLLSDLKTFFSAHFLGIDF